MFSFMLPLTKSGGHGCGQCRGVAVTRATPPRFALYVDNKLLLANLRQSPYASTPSDHRPPTGRVSTGSGPVWLVNSRRDSSTSNEKVVKVSWSVSSM